MSSIRKATVSKFGTLQAPAIKLLPHKELRFTLQPSKFAMPGGEGGPVHVLFSATQSQRSASTTASRSARKSLNVELMKIRIF